MIQLTNTLSRRKETFHPLKSGEVSLYTCGPTVYNFAHIGNLRGFLFYDTLRRTLQLSGYKVRHVMNVTDVGHLASDADEGEDKLEKGALREGKSVWEVASFYTEAFKHDMSLLGILAPNSYRDEQNGDSYARATSFIDSQIAMVSDLLKKGHAYKTQQGIYFDVESLPSYGELTGQKLEEKEIAVREEVVGDPEKKNAFDFALWFFTVGHFKNHSMRWDSPWGEGFPGWHLECSAIIHETLGDPIDIHTGGVDHIGTHHPNEMAQTEAAFGHPLAQYWLHNEFLHVDGGKMSKSKGNTYTLSDITAKGFSPMSFRLLILQAHYRSELNFTWESLEAAQNFLLRLYAWADTRFQPKPEVLPGTHILEASEKSERYWADMLTSMQDDLNSPAALAALTGLIDDLEQNGLHLTDIENYEDFLEQLDALFGLNFSARKDITDEQKKVISERVQVRINKDFAKSDQLRQKLKDQGIDVEDTSYGPVWRRNKI